MSKFRSPSGALILLGRLVSSAQKARPRRDANRAPPDSAKVLRKLRRDIFSRNANSTFSAFRKTHQPCSSGANTAERGCDVHRNPARFPGRKNHARESLPLTRTLRVNFWGKLATPCRGSVDSKTLYCAPRNNARIPARLPHRKILTLSIADGAELYLQPAVFVLSSLATNGGQRARRLPPGSGK